MNLVYAWVLPLIPLAVFVFVLATGRRLGRQIASWLGIIAMAVVFAASASILVAVAGGAEHHAALTWMSAGDVEI